MGKRMGHEWESGMTGRGKRGINHRLAHALPLEREKRKQQRNQQSGGGGGMRTGEREKWWYRTYFGHDDSVQAFLDPESPRRTAFQDEVDDDAMDRHSVHSLDNDRTAGPVTGATLTTSAGTTCRADGGKSATHDAAKR